MKNLIEETIRKNISDKTIRFVFPTQMAADLWSDRATLNCGVTAVAMERFIAWDDFKGTSIKTKQQEKKSVPSVMRTIFATLLIEENKKSIFLKKIIAPQYAEESSGFVSWVAGLLPSLSMWKKHLEENGNQPDEEDLDLLAIYNRYKKFLDENNFFDPAWETPPFESDGNRYCIFFPEILSDYSEYKEILEQTEDIDVISMPENYLPPISNTEELPDGYFFQNSRTELKNVALKIRQIHEENKIDWQDICISVPDMDSYGPYIDRELELYRIPHVMRFAKPLDSSGAGNFFSQAQECVNNKFSFDSIRNLLLNLELPWKDRESINQLIEFGKNNNCICSYPCNGKEIDVWQKSFETVPSENRAREFFESLKRHLTNMVNSKTFADLREEYFGFRSFAFNMEECSLSTDKIISRCISELAGLIDIENMYPKYSLPSPYSFFVKQLSSTKYLEQTDNLGVRVLSYKTAACAPFAYHVIVDASQSSLSVIYKPLSFLREDKRRKIFKGREDPNVTEHFISLYRMNSLSGDFYFTAAEKNFSGYSQMCSYMNEKKTNGGDCPSGFYDDEKNLYRNMTALKKVTDISKKGFEFWKDCQNLACEKDEILSGKTKETIGKKFAGKNGLVKISATSLKKFYNCPRLWAENYIADLEEPVNEATLIDDFSQGNLNHKILELYFSRLREKNLTISVDEKGFLKEEHSELLMKSIDQAIEELTRSPVNSRGNSFIATELIKATKRTLAENMTAVVTDFSNKFNGYRVLFTELSLSHEEPEKGYVLEGHIDLVITDDNQEIIIDYKKSKTPDVLYAESAPEAAAGDSSNLPDFQMPAYLYLLEKAKNIRADNCAFYSLSSGDIVPVIGNTVFEIFRQSHPRSKNPVHEREDFESTMNVFFEKLKEFHDRIEDQDFSVDDKSQDFEKCNSCTFRAVCRRVFNVSRKN